MLAVIPWYTKKIIDFIIMAWFIPNIYLFIQYWKFVIRINACIVNVDVNKIVDEEVEGAILPQTLDQ